MTIKLMFRINLLLLIFDIGSLQDFPWHIRGTFTHLNIETFSRAINDKNICGAKALTGGLLKFMFIITLWSLKIYDLNVEQIVVT